MRVCPCTHPRTHGAGQRGESSSDDALFMLDEGESELEAAKGSEDGSGVEWVTDLCYEWQVSDCCLRLCLYGVLCGPVASEMPACVLPVHGDACLWCGLCV